MVKKILSCIFAITVFIFGGICESLATPTFSVTTTNTTTSFQFSLSAVGTFTVDCGDGGTLTSSASDVSNGNTITRSGTTAATYTCTWSSAGAHTIGFDGTATNYNTNLTAAISFLVGVSDPSQKANAAKIASISGDLSAIFPYISGNAADGAQPRFVSTFSFCTSLTSIPSDLFSKITTSASYMFSYTFYGCTGLTSIPSDLFSKITTSASFMFSYTFYGCTGLTSLPSGLFSKITTGADSMFYSTFYGCTGLTSIPSDLFSKITTSASFMFSNTFNGCTGLTSLPSGLFFPNAQSVSGAQYMFSNTFNGCTGLTSLPSGLFFPNAQSVSGAQYMFNNTFNGCTGLTSLPSELFFPNAQSVSGAQSMFPNTFNGCTGLTSIPSDLFSKITTSASYMFSYTFRDCTNLGCATAGCSTGTGYIPPTLFAGITPRGSNYSSTMNNTFYNTKLVTTCPTGLVQYVTGWEGSSTWNDKVSCCSGNSITYVMNGGVNHNNPNEYCEGCGAIINGIPTKSGYVFAGWCTDSGLQNCAMSQTIGTDATTDKTFYAKWTQCQACNATNASCELKGVVNNVCTYTTKCNNGYRNIQNKGAYDAYCSPNVIDLTWLDNTGATITTNSCDYGQSITIPNTPSLTGYTFTGWKIVSVATAGFDLTTLDPEINIGGGSYDPPFSWIPISNDGYTTEGEFGFDNTDTFGLTAPGEWAAEFEYGIVRGEVRCSDTDDGKEYGQAGDPGSATDGQYCWGRVTGVNDESASLDAPWVALYNMGSPEDCAYVCAIAFMYDGIMNSYVRAALYGVPLE